MNIQRCKGTQDLTPEQMKKFRFIESVFRDCCIRWGYDEVRTPTLEYLHLFTSTGTLTPGRLNRVYSFLDWDGWSGERVVMRPDGTIPIARMYIDSAANGKPAKLFYVTNVFAFEETGKESREKWQCGVESLGAGSTASDVELITMALEVLKKSGIRYSQLKLSHAGLIRRLLDKFGLSREEQAKAFDEILDGNEKVLKRLKEEKPDLSRILTPLLDLKGKSSGFLKNMKALFGKDLPELESEMDNFISVVEKLEEMGIRYRIDISSGSGFEYYTGIIYQIIASGVHIGGGGRYDALIPLMGGGDVPASGFALYLDRVMEKAKIDTTPETGSVLVRTADEANLKGAFDLVKSLHEAGYIAGMDPGNGSDAAEADWVIEVGAGEIPFTVWDMKSGTNSGAATKAEVLKRVKGSE
ncbi:MAG: ATP phosphoribosyltransferase regulatory subunit [Dehalococcoidales bacterium]|jgi:histidyl-tRNA synthetase|nr:ATP phosphoribosyltransferase regulatory subunit [Dehalococcoidales bacterium]